MDNVDYIIYIITDNNNRRLYYLWYLSMTKRVLNTERTVRGQAHGWSRPLLVSCVFRDSASDYSWWSITDHLLLGDSWTRIDDRWSAFAASCNWPALLYHQLSPMPYVTVFLWFGRSWSQVSDAPCYEEYVVHWFHLSVSFHIVCWYNWSRLATWDQLKNMIRANIIYSKFNRARSGYR